VLELSSSVARSLSSSRPSKARAGIAKTPVIAVFYDPGYRLRRFRDDVAERQFPAHSRVKRGYDNRGSLRQTQVSDGRWVGASKEEADRNDPTIPKER